MSHAPVTDYRPTSAVEYRRLLERLRTLVPIVESQAFVADKRAEAAYYGSGETPPERVIAWKKHGLIYGGDMLRIDYRDPDTAEWRELISIGLAVAACGGFDAIVEIAEQVGGSVWHCWNGMAGFCE